MRGLDFDIAHLLAGSLVLVSFLQLYLALIISVFLPWGQARPGDGPFVFGLGIAAFAAKLGLLGALLALFETVIAKMRVFRVPEFLGAALMLGLLGTLLLFVSRTL